MRRQLSSAALAVPLVLVLLAGCAPSSATPSPGNESPAADQEERRLQFTQCLREQGIDIGDPDPNSGLPPMEDLTKFRSGGQKAKDAQEACKDKAPTGLSGRAK